MNEFGKYRLFRKYVSSDGVNYTPLDEYQALIVENDSCQCGYRELEYRFDGEYKDDTFNKYEIWNEYSFCPTDSSYDELTGNVDYRNPIQNEGVMLATYIGYGSTSVKLCNNTDFYERIAINNVVLENKTSAYTFNNTDINEVAYSNVTNIGDESFSSCPRLKSVTIPDSVTTIGNMAFYKCSGLTSFNIPDSVETIGRESFYGCSGLTSVKIGSGITIITNFAFGRCISLTSITIPNSVKIIDVNAFSGCESLISVTIPDSVTTIGGFAFYYCTSLTSVTIPDSVTSIDVNTFDQCISLTSVIIPDSVTSIGMEAFTICYSLTSITIPDSVTSIGNDAFHNCSGLTSVYIGSGLTSIGNDAFYGCKSLNYITCYATTKPSLGTSVFYNLPKNGTLHVPNGSDYSSWLSKLPSGWTIEYI